MPPKLYADFVVSDPFERPAKYQSGINPSRSYVSITCPHCHVSFLTLPIERVKTAKAGQCLTHLRVCDAAKAAGIEPPPPKGASPSLQDQLTAAQIKAAEATAEAEHARKAAERAREQEHKERTISERRKRERDELAHALHVPSPHSSDDEETRAAKRSRAVVIGKLVGKTNEPSQSLPMTLERFAAECEANDVRRASERYGDNSSDDTQVNSTTGAVCAGGAD